MASAAFNNNNYHFGWNVEASRYFIRRYTASQNQKYNINFPDRTLQMENARGHF